MFLRESFLWLFGTIQMKRVAGCIEREHCGLSSRATGSEFNSRIKGWWFLCSKRTKRSSRNQACRNPSQSRGSFKSERARWYELLKKPHTVSVSNFRCQSQRRGLWIVWLLLLAAPSNPRHLGPGNCLQYLLFLRPSTDLLMIVSVTMAGDLGRRVAKQTMNHSLWCVYPPLMVVMQAHQFASKHLLCGHVDRHQYIALLLLELALHDLAVKINKATP